MITQLVAAEPLDTTRRHPVSTYAFVYNLKPATLRAWLRSAKWPHRTPTGQFVLSPTEFRQLCHDRNISLGGPN